MKNTIKVFGIIALAAIITTTMVSCDEGGDNNGNGNGGNNNAVDTLLDGGIDLQGVWNIGASHLWNITSSSTMAVGDIAPLTYIQKHAPDNSYEVIYISWKNSGELWETVKYTVTDAKNIVITEGKNADPSKDTVFKNCIGQTVTWVRVSW